MPNEKINNCQASSWVSWSLIQTISYLVRIAKNDDGRASEANWCFVSKEV